MPDFAATLDRLRRLPTIRLAAVPTPVEELTRLRAALGRGPRLLVKRDDALTFAFGGNKVRKLELVAAQAIAAGADTLITCGGVQSNHARVTAAAAARLGLRAVLIVNGAEPLRPTANALLDRLFGAEVRYVNSRDDRAPAMEDAAAELRAAGRRPAIVPLGASTPLGAAAFALAVDELLEQIPAPDVIVHSTSSGGTQAGILAGCRLRGMKTRVLGISADDPASVLARTIQDLLGGIETLLEAPAGSFASMPVDVDDRFVGDGYGMATPESREALHLCARTEALLLDPTYTAKAMAGLLAIVREGRWRDDQTVLFWHTGGQVGLFA